MNILTNTPYAAISDSTMPA